MGHARAAVFRRHYKHQTVKVDTKSTYLGFINRSDLVKNISLMSISRDPHAPVKLGPGDLEKRQLDYPILSALQLEKDNLKAMLRTNIVRSKPPKSSYLSKYREHGCQINAARKRIERDALKDAVRSVTEVSRHGA